MPDVSPRLTAWIQAHFDPGTSERVLSVLRDLPAASLGGQDVERVHAALVLTTDGSWEQFLRNVELATIDWRDALVAGGLGNVDWPARLAEHLGRGT